MADESRHWDGPRGIFGRGALALLGAFLFNYLFFKTFGVGAEPDNFIVEEFMGGIWSLLRWMALLFAASVVAFGLPWIDLDEARAPARTAHPVLLAAAFVSPSVVAIGGGVFLALALGADNLPRPWSVFAMLGTLWVISDLLGGLLALGAGRIRLPTPAPLWRRATILGAALASFFFAAFFDPYPRFPDHAEPAEQVEWMREHFGPSWDAAEELVRTSPVAAELFGDDLQIYPRSDWRNSYSPSMGEAVITVSVSGEEHVGGCAMRFYLDTDTGAVLPHEGDAAEDPFEFLCGRKGEPSISLDRQGRRLTGGEEDDAEGAAPSEEGD